MVGKQALTDINSLTFSLLAVWLRILSVLVSRPCALREKTCVFLCWAKCLIPINYVMVIDSVVQVFQVFIDFFSLQLFYQFLAEEH